MSNEGPSPGPGMYPGLGLSLRCPGHDPKYVTAVDSELESASELLLVREVAMMGIMDQLTEKPDWHIKVFDDVIASKWIDEALAIPVESLWATCVPKLAHLDPVTDRPKRPKEILDRACLEYCIQELRAKARFFEKTGFVLTLDACATVVKSDKAVDVGLRDELRAAFAKLKDEQKDSPDWHPGTDEKVLDLVHPSMYPLVYGRSRVFADEVVGVHGAVDRWSGKGAVIDVPPSNSNGRFRFGQTDPLSTNYQWLPSNVKFQDDGTVKFTSYINGLHPNKHSDVYVTIEKLIQRALPTWDLCLVRSREWPSPNEPSEGEIPENVAWEDLVFEDEPSMDESLAHELSHKYDAARTAPRFPKPENPDDHHQANWNPTKAAAKAAVAARTAAGEDTTAEYETPTDKEWWLDPEEPRWERTWEETREPVQPPAPKFEAWEYDVKPGASIREQYKDIQVIVKMASVELTPEKPSFPVGGWHLEGQLNEHIVGTALYYLDSENMTPSRLEFRMQTGRDADEDYKVDQESYRWLERVFGTSLHDDGEEAACVQHYGSVETSEGRLLTFPNVFQHRVCPFELKDKTKPGHRSFIAIWLVDPSTRIINTANVPPQQQSWWVENAFRNLSKDNASKLPDAVVKLMSEAGVSHPALDTTKSYAHQVPREIFDLIRQDMPPDMLPMSEKEAREHRQKLMAERTAHFTSKNGAYMHEYYNFCEH